MKRVMHSVEVNTTVEGDIAISQRWNDMNERDPEITISAEQAPLLATWLLEAAEEASTEIGNTEKIPCKYWTGGPDVDIETLEAYNNDSGMIILRIKDDAYIEISPAMAKRLREQLSRAITRSLTDMLRPDNEA